jgi:hypothetical protein
VIDLLQVHASTLCCFQFRGFYPSKPDGTEDNDVDGSREWCEGPWRSVFAQLGKMEKLLDGELYRGASLFAKGWNVPVECGGRKVEIETDLARCLEGGDDAYEQVQVLCEEDDDDMGF